MSDQPARFVPGQGIVGEAPIQVNVGRRTATVQVTNTSVWPVHIGSHFHFFEVNRFLRFDRPAAYGRRLDIPAGTALRFEPGEGREVHLVPFAGERRAYGMSAITDGALDERHDHALSEAQRRGFIKERR